MLAYYTILYHIYNIIGHIFLCFTFTFYFYFLLFVFKLQTTTKIIQRLIVILQVEYAMLLKLQLQTIITFYFILTILLKIL